MKRRGTGQNEKSNLWAAPTLAHPHQKRVLRLFLGHCYFGCFLDYPGVEDNFCGLAVEPGHPLVLTLQHLVVYQLIAAIKSGIIFYCVVLFLTLDKLYRIGGLFEARGVLIDKKATALRTLLFVVQQPLCISGT